MTNTTASLQNNGSAPLKKNVQLHASEGRPHPCGARVKDNGVNFSLYSENATKITLLIWDNPTDVWSSHVFELDPEQNKTFNFWHIFIEGLKPGAGYAYRVDGPRGTQEGHRFNPNKVLLDPYAHGVSLSRWERGSAVGEADNESTCLRGIVIDVDDYDWEDDTPPSIPTSDTVIYEMHVGGFTKSPSSKVKHPGTFSGLIEKIPYLKDLGITAVELLPVFAFDDTEVLREHDGNELTNYWGYSTLNFFTPHHRYCVSPDAGSQLKEFRDMVKALHKAGIEVILDVVFNHTDEGNHLGPTYSFKGIDNKTYYYLTGENGALDFYMDYTGCGNTFNCNHPIGEKFILDCLTFWAEEMHVDGFRFDEGSILTRGEDGKPLQHPPVIWAIELSEKLSRNKVITEAWDAAGLYQVGYFPGMRWAEWNGKFRDSMRRFVRGEAGLIGDVASRITGSADLYQWRGHEPVNSVNFITAHDGFTLYDLVSYNQKNNWANGEDNHDGVDDNMSWNCGVEGPTDDPEIMALREKQVKNFAVLLILSMGVPMIVAGDENLRSQSGNNNTYCQDNELNWFDWKKINKKTPMYRFWRLLIQKRKDFLHHFRGKYYTGKINSYGIPEIQWFDPALQTPDWSNKEARTLAVVLGDVEDDADETRNAFVMMNMFWEPIRFSIPQYDGLEWHRTIDTAMPSPEDAYTHKKAKPLASKEYEVQARSIAICITKKSKKTRSK